MKKEFFGWFGIVVLFGVLVTFLVMVISADTEEWHDYTWFVREQFDDSSELVLGIEQLQTQEIVEKLYLVVVEVTVLEEVTEDFDFKVETYTVALLFDIIEPDNFWVRAKISFLNFFGVGERHFHYSHLKQVKVW
jgi:hypothetical protein